jgi:hypothetical protein
MALTAAQVRGRAQAFVEALSNLPAKQREQEPNSQYAENFNQLLALAREACPSVDPRGWPSPITMEKAAYGGALIVRATYAEIETYARQVMALIPHGIAATVLTR